MKKILQLTFSAFLGAVLSLVLFNYTDIETSSTFKTPPQSTPISSVNYDLLSTEEPLNNFNHAAEKTVHSVVHVKNIKEGAPNKIFEYFYGYQYKSAPQLGSGSGVIISPDGYIVTNHHVIDKATELSVTLNNNSTFRATLIGSDANTDIALLKIEAQEPLPYLSFGDSDMAKIGEWVLAVGNPFNLTSTVTAGIISAKARELGKNQSFIQTDAAVNPGNSGGALVNTRGDLIGINTAISTNSGSYMGYSFAVPSNIAHKVVGDIMEYGAVKTAVLGISAITSKEVLNEQYGVEDLEGVYISGVEEASAAEKAGLKEGDIIKQIDYLKVRKFSDLTGYLSSKRPYEKVTLSIARSGEIINKEVTLLEKQSLMLPKIGFTVKNLNKEDERKFKTNHGVKIINVPPQYKDYGLIGKVVTAIDDQEVKNIETAQKLFDQINRYQRTSLSMINEEGEKERLIFQ